MVDLYKHNQLVYSELVNRFTLNNRVLLTEATGCGKSYVAANFLENNFRDQEFLYISPSNILNDHFKDIVLDNTNISKNNIVQSTYQTINSIRKNLEKYDELIDKLNKSNNDKEKACINKKINKLNKYFKDCELLEFVNGKYKVKGYNFIIVDEMHRMGAPLWGYSINKFLDKNPKSKILGMSATPDRFVEIDKNKVEISKLFFNDNVVNGPNAFQAMKQGILPEPYYTLNLYDVYAKYNNKDGNISFEKLIDQHPWWSDEQREEEKLKLESAKALKIEGIDDTIMEVMAKSIEEIDEINQYNVVVFCADTNIIEHNHNLLDNSFKKLADNYNLEFMTVDFHSKLTNNEKDTNYLKFNNHQGFNVMYCVDMLNEGIHLNIDSIVMMRATKSYVTYMQQIGRVLQARYSNRKRPYIFDFVNNIELASQVLNGKKNKASGFGSKRYVDEKELFIYQITDVRNQEVIDKLEELYNDMNKDFEYHRMNSIESVANRYGISSTKLKKELEATHNIDKAIENCKRNSYNVEVICDGKKIKLYEAIKNHKEWSEYDPALLLALIENKDNNVATLNDAISIIAKIDRDIFDKEFITFDNQNNENSGTIDQLLEKYNLKCSRYEIASEILNGEDIQDLFVNSRGKYYYKGEYLYIGDILKKEEISLDEADLINLICKLSKNDIEIEDIINSFK